MNATIYANRTAVLKTENETIIIGPDETITIKSQVNEFSEVFK